MDTQWMKLKEWLEDGSKEKNECCDFPTIIRVAAKKMLLEKMEELENE